MHYQKKTEPKSPRRRAKISWLLRAGLLLSIAAFLPACSDDSQFEESMEEVEDETSDAADEVGDEIDDHT